LKEISDLNLRFEILKELISAQEQKFDLLLEEAQHHPEVLEAICLHYLEQKDVHSVIGIAKGNDLILRRSAYFLMGRGDLSEALLVANHLSEPSHVQCDIAIAYVHRNSLADATHVAQSISSESRDRALIKIALAHVERGEFEEALKLADSISDRVTNEKPYFVAQDILLITEVLSSHQRYSDALRFANKILDETTRLNCRELIASTDPLARLYVWWKF
jgi:hypothetical protein